MQLKEFNQFKRICSVTMVLLPCMGLGQVKSDSSAMAYDNAREIYLRALGPDLNLYNGVSYKGYQQYANDEGQPYFGSDVWSEGSVFYDGIFYENVSMLYDLVEDEVVIDHRFAGVKLELLKEKIDFFTIDGHHFIFMAPVTSDASLPTGFYELLYNGRYKAYARWQRKRLEAVGAHEIQVQYEEHSRFYIFDGEKYFPVKTKSSVLRLLKDKKSALQKYIRKQNLSFGAHCDESIPKVLSFYESGAL